VPPAPAAELVSLVVLLCGAGTRCACGLSRWSDQFTPQGRYKILTGGACVHQERQQTLQGAVDWSYDLLNAKEQILLARLGVFVGGFDLAAAEEVCGTDPVGNDDVLDLLGSLVDKSLVMLEEHDDTGRYRMLETIRDYAREKLLQRGESDATSSRHCAHYFVKAKVAKDGMKGPEQAEWIQRIDRPRQHLQRRGFRL
jgi:predicted ATPase